MAKRRSLYAFVMAAIYVAATLLSSLSLILCDHHHHHHHHHYNVACESKCECCSYAGDVIGNDCCDHHHPILGDNHTDYIDSSHRCLRSSQAIALMLASVVIETVDGEQSLYEYTLFERTRASKIALPQSPHLLAAGLRAPPCLA